MHSRNTITFSLLFCFFIFNDLQAQKDSSSAKYWSAGSKEIWQTVDGLLDDPNLSGATWGVVVQSVTSGEVLYKRNEQVLLNPASLVKLITTAAALSYLGGSYNYETEIRADGTIEGNRLLGDLIIVGFGDPTISGKFTNRDVYSVFNSWADKMIDLGVTEITGDLIGYDKLFAPSAPGNGWQWNNLGEWYSAVPSALAFNDNSVDVSVSPGDIGEEAEISLSPDTRFITVINQIRTVPADSASSITIKRAPGSNILRLEGVISSKTREIVRSVAVENPVEFFLVNLKEAFHRKGIKISGRIKTASGMGDDFSLEKSTALFKHRSAAFSDIVKVCNKNSHNFYAEQILRTMGLAEKGYGSFENGISVVNRWLSKAGIEPNLIRLEDGSGLSLLNLISADKFAKLLRYISKSDEFAMFYNSLPVAGRDGSLADRMQNGAAANNLRAKPGLNENVRSLAGYLKTADNETLSVVFIANNFLVPYTFIDAVIDKICNRLCILKRKK
ncbi:MAG: D-alanyl-D-alanine carboxypeptidase/D-alanyl-D-alanine-endopeptidase [Ignavibacteriales bacterium]|nr:MAG: D-alanyl-D-alanine carboxypeptidase/D-alanyl-D-alanine-endopeptidase [Ignavibacteriaceae bacterium]MBW7872348.1 D-alanyl-D-alanine carboxypeptidase/D-alanyl-D-alanine-endopeptidase [Ignavibacteria bacterium]MCZ2142631.1 D-alanyl-D-alanine carboxypeptidase/D-alanyl-D-alanine-endopeptidase [Ignavibacteriales bacterium]MBV6445505.1 D-alanyl-D-alanine carboxypeptidase DacC [Ignavibacteriaceae bacterium]MBZ0197670.1 D-alanyl-D-alanine carboxypeptidase/D-alanyl-D-alanine-endopeptidase [Ignavi